MDNHAGAAAVRAAVERIQAERKDWQGVGLMAIEHLVSGACGVVLVPADVPAPDWSRHLLERAPCWEQHEDVSLVPWLKRWHADLSSRPDERWTEWANLLRRHCTSALIASLPEPSRQVAVRHGLEVHALPPAAGDDLLGRLVAWALPWQELTMPRKDGGEGRKRTRACTSWVSQPGLVRSWTQEASMGAAGLTRLERLRAGGLHQWGILSAWPSAIDVLVAFLVAQADSMELPASTVRAVAADGRCWKDVQAELLAIMQRDRPNGKPCPTFRELGRTLGCSHKTVGKAFKGSTGLSAWHKETEARATRSTPPAAHVLPADGDEAVQALIREQAADFEASPMEPGKNPRVRKRA